MKTLEKIIQEYRDRPKGLQYLADDRFLHSSTHRIRHIHWLGSDAEFIYALNSHCGVTGYVYGRKEWEATVAKGPLARFYAVMEIQLTDGPPALGGIRRAYDPHIRQSSNESIGVVSRWYEAFVWAKGGIACAMEDLSGSEPVWRSLIATGRVAVLDTARGESRAAVPGDEGLQVAEEEKEKILLVYRHGCPSTDEGAIDCPLPVL